MTSLVGHAEQIATLLGASASGRMHHGWIFAGPEGVGKATIARAFATRLLAEAAGPQPDEDSLDISTDHRIARLIESGAHPDFVALIRREKDNGDLARNISVDQVRGLQRLIGNVPSLSTRRIVLIDSADDLERNAANALLKNLEEPPPDTLFLLVAHAPSRLLPTIRSRCRMLRFERLGESALQTLIARHLSTIDGDEARALIPIAEGSIGRAIALANLRMGEIDATLDLLGSEGDPDNRHRLTLALALSGKAARDRYEAFLDRAPSHIAGLARKRSGPALRDAVQAWEQARQLAAGATILSLDPAATVFEICSLIAGLAPAVADA